MWLRNLIPFRLAPEWRFDTDSLDDLLAARALAPCGATDRRSVGWLPVPGGAVSNVLAVPGQQRLLLGVETKVLPASVVRMHAGARALEIEAKQGYKCGRKQMREIRDAVELDLLARAFTQLRGIPVWIDTARGWLGVDAASPAAADLVIEALKATLGELPLARWKPASAPASAMTAWLAAGEAPHGFSIDRDGELIATSEGHASVRYARSNLDAADVREHIAQGKRATRLALTWRDRVSFVLTEQGTLKRIAALDLLREQAEESADTLPAAELALMGGELGALLDDLQRALGGTAE